MKEQGLLEYGHDIGEQFGVRGQRAVADASS
jgi:hypothetical protein